MNDIQNILIENGCDAETIANVVNDFRNVVVKHARYSLAWQWPYCSNFWQRKVLMILTSR